jgi:hypothetical protein
MRKEVGAPLFYTPRAENGQIGRCPAPRPLAVLPKIETTIKKVQVAAGGSGYDFQSTEQNS